MSVNHHVRVQSATGAQYHMLANHTVRPDFAIRPDFRPRMNNRRWMYHAPFNLMSSRRRQASRIMKVTSASLTTSPWTLHTPLARPIFPRILVSSTSITSTSPGTTGFRHFTSSAAMK